MKNEDKIKKGKAPGHAGDESGAEEYLDNLTVWPASAFAGNEQVKAAVKSGHGKVVSNIRGAFSKCVRNFIRTISVSGEENEEQVESRAIHMGKQSDWECTRYKDIYAAIVVLTPRLEDCRFFIAGIKWVDECVLMDGHFGNCLNQGNSR